MANAQFEGVRISGIAAAVPAKVDYVRDYAMKFGEHEVEKFTATTGCKERRLVSDKQTCGDLCFAAAEKLILHKGYAKGSFDAVILITQNPDYDLPATAHILHKRLGLSKDCLAMDINLGCSGFVYGVYVTAAMLKAGALKRVLLCCGDTGDYVEPESAADLLFAGAGTAVIMEPGADTIHALMCADGEGYQAILRPGLHSRVHIDAETPDLDLAARTQMDGGAVFEFGITEIPRAFKKFFALYGGTIDDYDYCVFHQANLMMLKHIAKKIRLPLEKMPVSIDRYGNTSSASIPLTISDLSQRGGDLPEKIHFIASGFGVGLSWGVVDFTLDRKAILPVIETDDYFKDAYVG